MKRLFILGMFAVAGAAFADIDHAQLINRPAGGTGAIAGQHLSQLETGETILGYGVQNVPPNTVNVMADDFTVGAGGFMMTGISVFSYVTGATAPGVTAVNWAVGAAPTRTLNTTNAASSFWSVGGLGVYRVASTTTSDANRRIQVTTVSGLNTFLGAGTHFLSFNVTPGNFSPPLPTSLATHGLNAMQSTVTAPTFAAVTNGTVGADMAFIIHGQAVPEPGTMAAIGLGIAALAARRRRK